LPCVTLLSEGRNFGTAKPAISQAAMTTQRYLTANAPIPPNMAWMRAPPAYKQAVFSKQAGPGASPGSPVGIMSSGGTQMIF